jgi:hypothetical protein
VQHKQNTYKNFKKKLLNYFFDGPASSSSRSCFLLVTFSEEPMSFDASKELVSPSSLSVLAGCVFASARALASSLEHV